MAFAHVTKDTLARLGNRAGITTNGKQIYDALRADMEIYAANILNRAVIIAEYSGRRKISAQILRAAFASAGLQLAAVPLPRSTAKPKTVGRNHKRGQVSKMQVRYEQKEANSLIFAFTRFKRSVNEILSGLTSEISIPASTLLVFQVAVEDYVTRLLGAARIMAIQAKRETVRAEDLASAKKISSLL